MYMMGQGSPGGQIVSRERVHQTSKVLLVGTGIETSHVKHYLDQTQVHLVVLLHQVHLIQSQGMEALRILMSRVLTGPELRPVIEYLRYQIISRKVNCLLHQVDFLDQVSTLMLQVGTGIVDNPEKSFLSPLWALTVNLVRQEALIQFQEKVRKSLKTQLLIGQGQGQPHLMCLGLNRKVMLVQKDLVVLTRYLVTANQVMSLIQNGIGLAMFQEKAWEA